jgi:RNA recognition motif-containing protein
MAAGRASVFVKESEKRGKLFLPTQLCKFYHAGCCTKGDCLYAHGLDEIHPDYSASAQERREEFHRHSGPEGSGEGYRVNVSNLACGVNADHLKTLFKKYGEVLDAKIQLKDGVCNGTGNVTFKTEEEARNALAKLNTKRTVWTEEHLPKTWPNVMVSAENKPLNVFVPPERQEDDDKNKVGKPHKKNNKTGRNSKMSPKMVRPQMQQQQQQQQQQFYPCCWTGVWCPVPVYHPSMFQGGMM